MNGLRLGILILGMISCGTLSVATIGGLASSSLLENMAWLPASSIESSSDGLKDRFEKDFGLLDIEDSGACESNDREVREWDMLGAWKGRDGDESVV